MAKSKRAPVFAFNIESVFEAADGKLRILATQTNVASFGRALADIQAGKIAIDSESVNPETGLTTVVVKTDSGLTEVTPIKDPTSHTHRFLVRRILTNPVTGEIVRTDHPKVREVIAGVTASNRLNWAGRRQVANNVMTKHVFAAILMRGKAFVFTNVNGEPVLKDQSPLFAYTKAGTIFETVEAYKGFEEAYLQTGVAFDPKAQQ